MGVYDYEWVDVSYTSVDSSWASAGIFDARSFSIGDNRALVHDLKAVKPNLVKGKCGVTAKVIEDEENTLAYWRDAYPTCKACLEA